MKKNTKLLFAKFVFFITTIFLSSCIAHATKQLKPPIENFIKIFTTLKLTMCDKKTKECTESFFRSTGSGLIMHITNDRVTAFTAGHICEPDQAEIEKKINTLGDIEHSFSVSIQVLNHKNTIYNSQVIISETMSKGESYSDLCLIEIINYDQKYKKITFSRTAPMVGEEVYYMGAPGGVYHPPVVPIFKGIFSGDVDQRSAMVTVPAAGGSSGGSILSTDNKIYSILFATHSNLPSISLVSGYTKTKDFIKKARLLLVDHEGTSIKFQPGDILHRPYMP